MAELNAFSFPAVLAADADLDSLAGRAAAFNTVLDQKTDTFLVLKPKSQWRVADKAWLIERLREALADLPGLEFAYTQPIEMRVGEMLTGARGDLAIKIFGPDLKALLG